MPQGTQEEGVAVPELVSEGLTLLMGLLAVSGCPLGRWPVQTALYSAF